MVDIKKVLKQLSRMHERIRCFSDSELLMFSLRRYNELNYYGTRLFGVRLSWDCACNRSAQFEGVPQDWRMRLLDIKDPTLGKHMDPDISVSSSMRIEIALLMPEQWFESMWFNLAFADLYRQCGPAFSPVLLGTLINYMYEYLEEERIPYGRYDSRFSQAVFDVDIEVSAGDL